MHYDFTDQGLIVIGSRTKTKQNKLKDSLGWMGKSEYGLRYYYIMLNCVGMKNVLWIYRIIKGQRNVLLLRGNMDSIMGIKMSAP